MPLDFKMSGEGLSLVSNISDRVSELCKNIDEILSSGILRRGDGEKLRGRLLFASGQLFGRRARNLWRMLSKHVHSNRKVLSDETVEALKNICKLLVNNLPRRIVGPLLSHLHIYIDAAFEKQGYCGVGGVVYDEREKVSGFFSEEVSPNLIQMIKQDGQVTVIQELEMLALLVAREVWCY